MRQKIVAVITPNERLFRLWVKKEGLGDVRYVKAQKIDDVRGRNFDELVDGYDSLSVSNTVWNAARQRLRTNVF